MLYSLYAHDCVAGHSANSIIKFADDTTVVGRITDGDESEYRSEVDQLTKWCQHNHLALNISKTKELIGDYGRGRDEDPQSCLYQWDDGGEGQKLQIPGHAYFQRSFLDPVH